MENETRATVAVVGAGIMGTAIVTRLLETGHQVHVFDLDQERVAALSAKGYQAVRAGARALKGSPIHDALIAATITAATRLRRDSSETFPRARRPQR